MRPPLMFSLSLSAVQGGLGRLKIRGSLILDPWRYMLFLEHTPAFATGELSHAHTWFKRTLRG
jgi:hypothetical protein